MADIMDVDDIIDNTNDFAQNEPMPSSAYATRKGFMYSNTSSQLGPMASASVKLLTPDNLNVVDDDGNYLVFNQDNPEHLDILKDAIWEFAKRKGCFNAAKTLHISLSNSIKNEGFRQFDELHKGSSAQISASGSRSGSKANTSASETDSEIDETAKEIIQDHTEVRQVPTQPQAQDLQDGIDRPNVNKNKKDTIEMMNEAGQSVPKPPPGKTNTFAVSKEVKNATPYITHEKVYRQMYDEIQKEMEQAGLKGFAGYNTLYDYDQWEKQDGNVYNMINYFYDRLGNKHGFDPSKQDEYLNKLLEMTQRTLVDVEKSRFYDVSAQYEKDPIKAESLHELSVKNFGIMKDKTRTKVQTNPLDLFDLVLKVAKVGKQIIWDPVLTSAEGAQQKAAEIGGTATYEDWDNNGENEWTIRNRRGIPVAWDGWSTKGVVEKELKKKYYQENPTKTSRKAVGPYHEWKKSSFLQVGQWNDFGQRNVFVTEEAKKHLMKLADQRHMKNWEDLIPRKVNSFRNIYLKHFGRVWKYFKQDVFTDHTHLWNCLPKLSIFEIIYTRIVLRWIWENMCTDKDKSEIIRNYNRVEHRTPNTMVSSLKKWMKEHKKVVQDKLSERECIIQIFKLIEASRGWIYKMLTVDLTFNNYYTNGGYSDTKIKELSANGMSRKRELDALFNDLKHTWKGSMKTLVMKHYATIFLESAAISQLKPKMDQLNQKYNKELNGWKDFTYSEAKPIVAAPQRYGNYIPDYAPTEDMEVTPWQQVYGNKYNTYMTKSL